MSQLSLACQKSRLTFETHILDSSWWLVLQSHLSKITFISSLVRHIFPVSNLEKAQEYEWNYVMKCVIYINQGFIKMWFIGLFFWWFFPLIFYIITLQYNPKRWTVVYLSSTNTTDLHCSTNFSTHWHQPLGNDISLKWSYLVADSQLLSWDELFRRFVENKCCLSTLWRWFHSCMLHYYVIRLGCAGNECRNNFWCPYCFLQHWHSDKRWEVDVITG